MTPQARSTEPPVPVWVSAFLDVAASAWPAASEYWSRLTGWPLSVPRGELDEFATLVPPDGDDYLRVQRLGDGPSRIHLDLHVDHLATSCDRAVALGATEVAQVCIDVAATDFSGEVAFWAALTGRVVQPFDVSSDFVALARPPGEPLRLILQRLGAGDPGRPARAHLEWWTDDLAAEVERHLALGARAGSSDGAGPYWAVLRDPADLPYCVVEREPDTGAALQPASRGTPE